MKKKRIVITLFALIFGACVGCSNEDGDRRIYSELQNYRLENVNDYQALGVGSLGEPIQGKSKRQAKNGNEMETAEYVSNHDLDSQFTSPNKFTLIGKMNDGEIKNLSFSNGTVSLNVEISSYYEWGNFISFMPVKYNEENSTYELYNSCDLLFCDYFRPFYTLSKKTGKIYKTEPFFKVNGAILPNPGSGFIIATDEGNICFAVSAINDAVLKIYENEQGLNFKFLGDNHYCMEIDNYGNVLLENGIITNSDSALHSFSSYLNGKPHVEFNHISGEIFAYLDDDYGETTYVFDKNERFVEVESCGVLADYVTKYDIEDNTRVQTNFNDKETWDISILNHWLESKKDEISNYEELKENHFSTITKKQFFDAYCYFYYRYNDRDVCRLSILEDGSSLMISEHYCMSDNNEKHYNKWKEVYTNSNGISFNSSGSYKRLDQHTFISIYDETISMIQGSKAFRSMSIKRGGFIYSLNSDGTLYKYSFETRKAEKLAFEEKYFIKDMQIENGKIALTGTDSSFNEIKGYLDQNDQISFEQTKSNDVVILSPIN